MPAPLPHQPPTRLPPPAGALPVSSPVVGPAPGRAADSALPEHAARAARDLRLAALLRQAAAGNSEAFEAFYDATFGYAQAMARRLLRGADLDDALAEAYWQVWREAVRFDENRGSPVTWLLTIVRSRALDLLRQRHAEIDAVAAEEPADGRNPHDLLCAMQAGTRLHAALALLSAQERWLLGLAYFRELPHSKISQQTGLPLGTVKSAILRAQGKLRDMLATDRP